MFSLKGRCTATSFRVLNVTIMEINAMSSLQSVALLQSELRCRPTFTMCETID